MRWILLVAGAVLAAAPSAAGAPPDYKSWGALLARHYDPARGMAYEALKAQDQTSLGALRRQLATVEVSSLSRPDQLAYWINLYNISVVGTVVDRYPVASIRDLSTDPILRLNVFKKPTVRVRDGAVSLNEIENVRIREGFKDPRIHFALNCAAQSCPPIRTEPYVGPRIDEQLDDQARRYLNGPKGVRIEADRSEIKLHVSKIFDWFASDFKRWGGGQVAFLERFLAPDKVKRIAAAGREVDLDFDDYSWKLNDASK